MIAKLPESPATASKTVPEKPVKPALNLGVSQIAERKSDMNSPGSECFAGHSCGNTLSVAASRTEVRKALLGSL